MTLAELQEMLDTCGAAPSAWPAEKRGAAERLIRDESTAREALERATRLDLLVTRALRADLPGAVVPAHEAAIGRINALAAGALPPQRRGMFWWLMPKPRADIEYVPIWPRVAALACVALLGFGIGMFGLDPGTIEGSRGAAASTPAVDLDLSVVALDPEPLTGVRP
jgi:hypothetical protein